MVSHDAWLQSDLVKELKVLAYALWDKGWGERNAGNISVRLNPQQMAEWGVAEMASTQWYDLPKPVPALAGQHMLMTASGAFMRHVKENPEQDLGLVRFSEDGSQFTPIAGYAGGGRPSSEMITHLLVHAERQDKGQSVIVHTHADWLLLMSHLHDQSSEAFTKTLWRMCSESLMFFPDGVGVVPWMLPGSLAIGEASGELAKTHRLILWAFHGVLAAGDSLDDAFGLIETAEKAAMIYCQGKMAGRDLPGISDAQIVSLGKHLGVTPIYELDGR
ncbi:rhamnulose-1-phosphate aldolase [Pseudovibrio sp. SPO723]|uniref:rhamnulose-1-phosphate aldolase n=1 Tax=Nesiotobacter zosterae TaxID=392721 RepID=UPI0029C1AF68|nr:rhamnulose-1-phosphate aldolase [Pseudovibrio sp. SPO723]MDX5594582.1 rhamnulose-1-phosphate aldolase [Pseudovibrio sp. SPO723]